MMIMTDISFNAMFYNVNDVGSLSLTKWTANIEMRPAYQYWLHPYRLLTVE